MVGHWVSVPRYCFFDTYTGQSSASKGVVIIECFALEELYLSHYVLARMVGLSTLVDLRGKAHTIIYGLDLHQVKIPISSFTSICETDHTRLVIHPMDAKTTNHALFSDDNFWISTDIRIGIKNLQATLPCIVKTSQMPSCAFLKANGNSTKCPQGAGTVTRFWSLSIHPSSFCSDLNIDFRNRAKSSFISRKSSFTDQNSMDSFDPALLGVGN
ncbi:hypothetical protein ACFE04_016501 [Oxalis oulophora]